MPARRRCISASPPRRPPGPAFTASTRPARKAARRHHVEEEMREHLGVDSSSSSRSTGSTAPWARRRGATRPAPQYCDACFSGEYPVAPSDMDLHMAVVLDDAAIAGAHRVRRAFEQLQVEIGAADQGPRDPAKRIAAPGMHENAVQHRLVEAERAGGVDQADKVHGAALPRVGAIGGSRRSNAPTSHQMGPGCPPVQRNRTKQQAPRPFPGAAPRIRAGGALRRGISSTPSRRRPPAPRSPTSARHRRGTAPSSASRARPIRCRTRPPATEARGHR
jgi:hypothetical protein